MSVTGWTGGRNPWAIALVVTMATFMEVLDTSIANVSLPHIAGNLSVTEAESTSVLTAYLIANAVVLPISGWLATRIGRKRFYMTCVALFVVSSFLCGVAPNLGALVFFRVLQGIGGGGLAPSEQAILADTFPEAKRGMAMAVYGMAVITAPAIGPTLGGFITEHYSWRWVFLINVPVGLVSLLLTSRMVSDPPHLAALRERAQRIDRVGLVLVAVGLGCLEYVLDKGQEDDWFHSRKIVAFAVVCAVSLAAFVAWELEHPNPIIDVRMFRSRAFATTAGMMLALGIALYGSTVVLPAFQQMLMGYTAQQAGMALSPGSVVIICCMPIVGALVSRVDARILIAFGFAAMAASLFYMTTRLYVGIDFKHAVLFRVYQMIGMACLFVPINTLAYVGVPPEKSNAVAGVMNLARNIGGSVGIAVVTTVIARHSQVHQAHLANFTNAFNPTFMARVRGITGALEHAGSSSTAASKESLAVVYAQMQREAAQLAYLDAIRALAVVALCALPFLLLAKPTKGGAGAVGH